MCNKHLAFCRSGRGLLQLLLLTMLICTKANDVAAYAPPKRVARPSPRILRITSLGSVFDGDTSFVDSAEVTDHSCLLDPSKRRLFLSSVCALFLFGATAASPALAVKGAAEYDFEYYMRDLFMGNNREGNLPVSNAPPPHSPRKLQGLLLSFLLDDELQTCIPILELSQRSKIPIVTLSAQIKSVRSQVQSAFMTSHPWIEEFVRDEYYFDLTCYALWRTAASVLAQDYAARDMFVRNIGRRLLNEIMIGFLSKKSIDTLQSTISPTLTGILPCVVEVLNVFQSSNYCTGYCLGDKNDDVRTGLKVFDSLDDEEISTQSGGGGSVDCLVSIFDPATLGGALQINGEGSRFAPDFIGPVLAAVWERVGGDGAVLVSFESYFVDPVYRPNPKDFFPNERLYQFTITRY